MVSGTVSILKLIFMVLFISSVHSSRNRLQGVVAEHIAREGASKDLERYRVKGMGKGASVTVAEDSAREVPTGPDPLHHNNNPTRPRAHL